MKLRNQKKQIPVDFRKQMYESYKMNMSLFGKPILPYPPYRERLHPRKHWQRKPYWLRTRSNPKKKGYH